MSKDIKAASTYRFAFTTAVGGVPTALAGSPAISVYKDANTTESTAGVTLTASFDGKTGLNMVEIDTSADGTFYSAGSDFNVWISAGTVGGSSVVGTVIEQFSIEKEPVNWAQVTAPTTSNNLSGTTVGTVTALGTQAKADVNAEVLDVLNVDTFSQPGQGTPAATTTIRLMLAYLYKAWRNRTTQTASEYDLYNDDAVTVDQKGSFSDNGTTADRGEIATGP